MAKITKLKVLGRSPLDREVAHWSWAGVCPCGQECEDSEIATEKQMRINASATVCTTCMSEASNDYDWSDYDWDEDDYGRIG